MKAEFVSTLVHREISRSVIARTQEQLAAAQREVSTGRHADIGKSLGAGVARLIDTRLLASDLDAQASANGIVETRLQETQSALSGMVDLAQGFFDLLLSSSQTGSDRALLVEEAKSRLAALEGLLSTTSNGAHIFSGINSAVAPMESYLAEPPGAARSSVQGAFLAEFGFAPDDPAVPGISAAQMEDYLSGSFALLFQDTSWKANFSTASDEPLRDRISKNETLATSVSANSSGIRELVQVLVAAVDSGTGALDAEAFQSLTRQLATVAGRAIHGLLRTQGEVGIAQERLAKASERTTIERTLLAEKIGLAEGVDAYGAAVRLTTLQTQIEASYAVTARVQQLSLLSYL